MKAATDFVALLVLPPAGPLLVLIAGLVLSFRRRRIGLVVALAAAAALWGSSMEAVGNRLLQALEMAPVRGNDLVHLDAIVVLGGGLISNSPEYGEDVLVPEALARVRYAAHLARATGAPVMLSGGNPYGGSRAEAAAMAEVLKEFGVTPRWEEASSTTTAQNAGEVYGILGPQGRRRIALVTSAWHMPRASRVFRRAGFDVVAAPTSYVAPASHGPLAYLPSAAGLAQTRIALWEWLGLAWYRLRGVA